MPKDDRKFEAYLAGTSEVSRVYAQSHEQPSSKLDESILDLARRSTHRRSRSPSPFANSWQIRGALAASIVLSASLAFYWFTEELPQTPLIEVEPTELKPTPSSATEAEAISQPAPLSETLGETDRHYLDTTPDPQSSPPKSDRSVAPPQETDTQKPQKIQLEPPIDAATPAAVTPPTDAEPILPPEQYSVESEARSRSASEASSLADEAPVSELSEPLQVIQQLLDSGQTTQARQALEALLKQYPSLELPVSMRKLLNEQPQ